MTLPAPGEVIYAGGRCRRWSGAQSTPVIFNYLPPKKLIFVRPGLRRPGGQRPVAATPRSNCRCMTGRSIRTIRIIRINSSESSRVDSVSRSVSSWSVWSVAAPARSRINPHTRQQPPILNSFLVVLSECDTGVGLLYSVNILNNTKLY